MTRRSLVLRCIYAACLLGATYNHVAIVAQHGLLWDYGGVGWASAGFWTSLTIVDPLAVILLFAWPRAGVLATGIIIAADVVHNLGVKAAYMQPGRFVNDVCSDPSMVLQIAFLLFVGATAPAAWPVSKDVAGGG